MCDMLVALALMLNLFSDSDELAIHKALLCHLGCWGFKVSMIKNIGVQITVGFVF